jgi:hypothetical protein
MFGKSVKTCNYNNICAFVSFQIKRKLGACEAAEPEEGSEDGEEVLIGADTQADDDYDGVTLVSTTVLPADQDTWLPGLTPKCKDSKGTETCL